MTDEVLGKDISLNNGTDLKFSVNQDFDTISGRDNLTQAIFSRLSTIKGEYFIEAYGSEINSVIGQPRDDLLKNRLSGYVVEALNQEPRIQEIQDITVTFPEEENSVEISITILPIDSQVPLNLIFPLFI